MTCLFTFATNSTEFFYPDIPFILKLRRIGLRFFELGSGQVKSSFEGDICELGRYNYGFQYVYAKALEYYGLHQILRRIQRSTKIEINLYDAVLLMLLERLQEPGSKKSNYEHQQEYLNLQPVELQPSQ